MKKLAVFIVCVFLFLAAGVTAYAAQDGTAYYVDAVCGNDENDGTSPDCAWKTMSRASQNEFAPGDSLLLKRGQVFGGNFMTNGSGSENAPVVFSAYGDGAAPVIHAEKGEFIFVLQNVSHWVVENLELTSDDYGVIIVAHSGEDIEDITVRNCYFHDISPDETDSSHSALLINNERGKSRMKNIHLDSLRIENVAWGVHTNGTNAENDRKLFISPEESYNRDYLFENI
ncbi:MAG: hypothetical protein MJ177_01520, partial [Clostridia bacterium]|nr:hypothetical protein [Clostridia bacterium]